MELFESSYYRVNKRSLQFYGHWPFNSSIKNRYHQIIMYFILMSIFIPKFIKILEAINDRDYNEVIECMPMVTTHLLSHTKFICWAFTRNKMKKLFIIMQKDWNTIKVKGDRDLLYQYANRGRLSMQLYATAIFGVVAVYFSSALVPKFLDIVKPLNESRPHIFLYETEYLFFDQDKYYLEILIHSYLTVPISCGVIVYFDSMLACYVSHVCGCFAVVSENLKRLHVETESDKGKSDFQKSQSLHKRIKYCAKIHSNTLEFVELVESSISTALIFVIGFSVIIVTLTGIVSVIKLDKPNEAARFMAFAFGGIYHLYYISSQGNLIIQESEAVHRAAYFCEWYTLPPTYRKLIIVIMMRSRKPAKLTAGKLYTLCNESFGDGLKKCMSLFTLIKSSL